MPMLNEQDFIKQYSDLLIKQYWEKPRAKAEIELMARTWYKCYRFIYTLDTAFDLDNAFGNQLDVIGRIVGLPRLVPDVVAKTFFGFSDNSSALGFGSKFNSARPSAPFFSKFGQSFTAFQLGDDDYKFFIRAKILKNSASGYITSDEFVSIQDVVLTLFDGRAFVTDFKDMSIVVGIDINFSPERLAIIKSLDLIPTPLGVQLTYAPPVYYPALNWYNVMNFNVPQGFN